MNQFSCLTNIPDFTKGLVRELRVRWAHEEMGIPYEAIVYQHPEIKKDEYKKLQPFGQVPFFRSGDLTMFETGAILLHLAMKHNKLLPSEENDRAHAFTWMFAALNSLEPYMFHYFLLKNDPEATEGVRQRAKDIIDERMKTMSALLGDKKYFGEDFSIAELIMTTVLKTALALEVIGDHKNLVAYVERNESRPAFQRALSAHVKLYEKGNA